MTTRWIISVISGIALVGVTLGSALPSAAEQAPGKNGPGVTRVSIVQGQIVVQRGDSNKQVAAVVNAPLLPGDYVSSGAGSRGELQFDGSSAVRLGANVQARITNDDPNNRQLQLADGTIELGLVRNGEPIQVDTPSVTVRARDAGDYRVSIAKDGSSWITARRGSAEVVTPQRTYTLSTGRTLVARGSASDPSVTYTSEVGYDSFDDFNAKRDQTMVAALNASPNLNPDIAGYDNLGAYGQWQDVSGYGQAWVPNEPSDWSPYANGSWAWEGGYGWTWVASEPWGWAPYHYGNWFYANGYGWAWLPPAYSAYPSWSPALVGFFGFGVGGPGWGVSVGFGYPYIGWYPIAPYQPFYPWWPGWAWNGFGWGWGGWGCCGWGFGNVVNVTNITYINRIYRYGGVHGTLVGHFQHGSLGGHVFRVDPHKIGGHIGMVHGGLRVAPTRDSLGFGGHAISAPIRLSRAFDSPRFTSVNRSLAGRMSFDDQQRAVSRAIQSNGRASAPVSREGNAPRADHGTITGSGGENRGALNGEHSDDRGTLNATHAQDRATTAENRESARGDSWQRFNETRGTQMQANARGNEARANEIRPGDIRANAVESRVERTQPAAVNRAPSDSWGRFEQSRGESYARGEPYSRGESSSRGNATYERNPYESSRGSYPSYSRGNASYERNPYESTSRGSYPSYSRGSYPSYSRGSYPSYSRGSYPSYSRGSYPTYSRGSYPSYERSAPPSYQRSGGYSAPHPPSGSSAPHPSGGGDGGGSRNGGHRPPTG
jgi:hypothetical protein